MCLRLSTCCDCILLGTMTIHTCSAGVPPSSISSIGRTVPSKVKNFATSPAIHPCQTITIGGHKNKGTLIFLQRAAAIALIAPSEAFLNCARTSPIIRKYESLLSTLDSFSPPPLPVRQRSDGNSSHVRR
jgi:hypothetical protein